MSVPEGEPQPVDLNGIQADDVPPIPGTIPKPEPFVTPPPVDLPRGQRAKRGSGSRRSPGSSTRPGAVRGAPPTEIPRPKKGSFVGPVSRIYTGIGIALMPFDPVCANSFVVNAETCAKAWDQAAYTNDVVRRMLTEFFKYSVSAELIAAHVPLAIAITIHHSSRAQDTLAQMGQGFAETVENNMRSGDMGNGVEEP